MTPERRRLRIWLVNHYAVLPTQPGGTRHWSLARRLVERGHRVTVFASSFHHLLRKEMRLGPGEARRAESVDGVEFIWLRTRPYAGNDWRRAVNMAEFALRLVAEGRSPAAEVRPDVVVGSSPHPLAALAVERVAARLRVPFVLEVRDLWPETFIELGKMSRSHPLALALGRLERYLYRRAARIVTVWSHARDYIVRLGVDAERVHWIPNGVDLGLVPSPRPLPTDGPFTVMFAGLHCHTVGLEHLLDAAEILQKRGWKGRMVLRLVGEGPEKASLVRRASERGLELVRFEDPVPKAEVYDLLSQAHVLLSLHRDIPLYRWGIGDNKLYDALAAARPVVLTGDPPLNPVREAGAGLVVRAGDPVALADALETLAGSDPASLEAMGRSGRRYAEANHDLARLAERLEEVLYAAVGEAGRQATSPEVRAQDAPGQAPPPSAAKKRTKRES